MSLKLKMQRAVLAFSLLSSFAGPVLCAPASRDSFEAFERDVDAMMRIPTRPDAVYRVGSTTKMFTAVAILQLIQSGKLAIDASVRTIFQSRRNHGSRLRSKTF